MVKRFEVSSRCSARNAIRSEILRNQDFGDAGDRAGVQADQHTGAFGLLGLLSAKPACSAATMSLTSSKVLAHLQVSLEDALHPPANLPISCVSQPRSEFQSESCICLQFHQAMRQRFHASGMRSEVAHPYRSLTWLLDFFCRKASRRSLLARDAVRSKILLSITKQVWVSSGKPLPLPQHACWPRGKSEPCLPRPVAATRPSHEQLQVSIMLDNISCQCWMALRMPSSTAFAVQVLRSAGNNL